MTNFSIPSPDLRHCTLCCSSLHVLADHDEAYRANAKDIADRYNHHAVSPLRKAAEYARNQRRAT